MHGSLKVLDAYWYVMSANIKIIYLSSFCNLVLFVPLFPEILSIPFIFSEPIVTSAIIEVHAVQTCSNSAVGVMLIFYQ
jgi:hypothetical protein